jgi:mxaJ protein
VRHRRLTWCAVAALACLFAREMLAAPAAVLRVCADPNNLPFSDRDGSGFENQLAQMLGRDLQRRVEYVWWATPRGAQKHAQGARM